MCSHAARLLVVWVVVCVVRLTQTVSQRITNYCFDDNNDNDVYALNALVFRLQNTVERLQQHVNDSLEQQQEYVIKLESTMKQIISTLEQRAFIQVCLS